MTIRLRDRKLLWARSGNRCAFPDCSCLLVVEAEESGADVVVAQECHIVAESPEGPRGASPFTAAERNAYPNLVLMCMEHHKVIDDDAQTWTVDRLQGIKSEHERRVAAKLSPGDRQTAHEELTYANIVTEWEVRIRLGEWRAWTSWLLAPTPDVSDEVFRDLAVAAEWLFSRPWPGLYPGLERSFENFRRVLADLTTAIAYGLENDGSRRRLIPLYHKRHVDNYDELAERFNWTVDLFHDLVLELTRAANWICEEIRAVLDPLYRIEEGVLIVERQDAGLFSKLYKPAYSHAERMSGYEGPYVGLDDFLDRRADRDGFFGEGRNKRALLELRPKRVGPSEP